MAALGSLHSKGLSIGPWMRAAAFTDGPVKIVEGDYSAEDIAQGSLGDCYLLSAFSVLAGHPQYIEDLLLSREVDGSGVLGARLWKNGKWQEVIVSAVSPQARRKAAHRGAPAPRRHRRWTTASPRTAARTTTPRRRRCIRASPI
ncbi:hypothetical protein GWI34_42445, partial [Actinomadura sp. DSM 109109]|nr:hypothetical protein [Actinomadura lepetitiana]